ncbi:winged-helix domain-containing protein [Anatilimnocola floriformis]|uniref:winged-helix domain-containing protein n=1 Tax=Anatilimnocola floriformis TaxID=2948575 RepID=UPI0036F23A7F
MIAPANFDAETAIDRVLYITELLRHASCPLSAGTLADRLAERTSKPWSKRTVLRDLRLLHRRGYVEPSGGGKRGSTVVWQWRGVADLSARRPSA